MFKHLEILLCHFLIDLMAGLSLLSDLILDKIFVGHPSIPQDIEFFLKSNGSLQLHPLNNLEQPIINFPSSPLKFFIKINWSMTEIFRPSSNFPSFRMIFFSDILERWNRILCWPPSYSVEHFLRDWVF